MRRILVRLLIALVLLIGLAAGAGWYLLSGSLPRLDGSVTVVGPVAPVTLERDVRGTLTVEGKSRHDVAWGLGYAHGQDRFFQMDLLRRVAAGELSALVGAAALKVDEGHRLHRLRDVARRAYEALPDDQRDVIDAYRDGVNAGLGALRVRPWEYLTLRQSPQPWKGEDTLLVLGAMYLDLNEDGTNHRERMIGQLRATLPSPLVDALLAPDPRWEAPLDGSLSADVVLPGPEVIDLHHADGTASPSPAPLPELPGSNSFAVGGGLTADGAALVANDMHLGLRVPDIWYRARLRFPDATAPGGIRDLNGVTLPGTPALVAGSNGQVAWGFTNTWSDWMDFVRVERDPSNPSRYRAPGGWATFEVHDEIIDVARGEPRHLRVEDTRWGPLAGTGADGAPVALVWIAHDPHAFNLGIMKLERVTSAAEALDVASGAGMPPQNLLAGDREGNIGWTVMGNAIPLRTGPEGTWQGYAPPERYPRVFNPQDQRLWTANNRTVGGDAFALLGNGGQDLGARARQIRDDLRARTRFTPADMLAIQTDDRAVFLTRWQQLLQAVLAHDDGSLAELKKLTARWQGRADVDSVDYRLVRTFRQNVREAVLAPFIARAKARFPDVGWSRGAVAEAAIWAMVERKPMNLLDARWKDWNDLLLAAARKTADDLGRLPGGLAARTWGEANTAKIAHPLSAALPAFLSRALDMPAEPLPGDTDMPRIQGPSFGASERFAISPGHEDRSYLDMPGGQSGHPLSPFHGAGHDDWVHGRPTPLLPGPAAHRLALAPEAR
ncbi:penicillin acylase family protein [Luteibacter aegosomatis]|uniref:penicillin acylase family protein n=1 Tax=Luteibacter aegosomatis TaxID=2911537 RepID=UPI001FF9C793|nr:penicillin acylase family protein [Luteibacter aegosomatis]UPG86776.1 penicillin acylase family protein [Luteibacter aegosomatis]